MFRIMQSTLTTLLFASLGFCLSFVFLHPMIKVLAEGSTIGDVGSVLCTGLTTYGIKAVTLAWA